MRALMQLHRLPILLGSLLDVSPREFFPLAMIEELCDACAPGEEVFVSSLLARSHRSPPAMSQMLGMLERKGYVSRAVAAGDRRKVAIAITDSGRAHLRWAKQDAEATTRKIMTRFGQDDTRELVRLTDGLTATLAAMRREASPADAEDGLERDCRFMEGEKLF